MHNGPSSFLVEYYLQRTTEVYHHVFATDYTVGTNLIYGLRKIVL